MKVYTLSRSKKYIIIIFMLLVIAVTVGALAQWLIFSYDTTTAYWAFPLALLLTGFCIWQIQEARVSQLVIGPDYVREDSAIRSRELLLHEIKGYQKDVNGILLIPFSADQKKIKIPHFISGYPDICYWVYARYPDVDLQKEEIAQQQQAIDKRYGLEKEDPVAQQKKAVLMARILNTIAILVSIASCFAFRQSWCLYTLPITILIPWIAMAGIHYYKGLFTINRKEGISLRLEWSLVAPSLALATFIFHPLNIPDYTPVWIPLAVITLVTGVTLWRLVMPSIRTYTKRYQTRFLATYFLVIPMYAYGTILTLNCGFDNSEPHAYESLVTDKSMSGGEYTIYYLQVAPWGPVAKNTKVTVPKELYDQTKVKETITIYLKKGLLNIPWYVAAKKI